MRNSEFWAALTRLLMAGAWLYLAPCIFSRSVQMVVELWGVFLCLLAVICPQLQQFHFCRPKNKPDIRIRQEAAGLQRRHVTSAASTFKCRSEAELRSTCVSGSLPSTSWRQFWLSRLLFLPCTISPKSKMDKKQSCTTFCIYSACRKKQQKKVSDKHWHQNVV